MSGISYMDDDIGLTGEHLAELLSTIRAEQARFQIIPKATPGDRDSVIKAAKAYFKSTFYGDLLRGIDEIMEHKSPPSLTVGELFQVARECDKDSLMERFIAPSQDRALDRAMKKRGRPHGGMFEITADGMSDIEVGMATSLLGLCSELALCSRECLAIQLGQEDVFIRRHIADKEYKPDGTDGRINFTGEAYLRMAHALAIKEPKSMRDVFEGARVDVQFGYFEREVAKKNPHLGQGHQLDFETRRILTEISQQKAIPMPRQRGV